MRRPGENFQHHIINLHKCTISLQIFHFHDAKRKWNNTSKQQTKKTTTWAPLWEKKVVKLCFFFFLQYVDKEVSTFINRNCRFCSICLTVLAITITNDHPIDTKEQELSVQLQNLFLSHRLKWLVFQWLLCIKDLKFGGEAVLGCGKAAEQTWGCWTPSLLLITWEQTSEATHFLLPWVAVTW